MAGLESEREEIAKLLAELAGGRSIDVQLFAAEAAGRIRARSMPAGEERVALADAARMLGICRGRLPRLVAERILPEPDDRGTFLKSEIAAIALWIGPRATADAFDRISKIKAYKEQKAGH